MGGRTAAVIHSKLYRVSLIGSVGKGNVDLPPGDAWRIRYGINAWESDMTPAHSGLILTEDDLAGLGISSANVVETIEQAVRAESAGKIWTAPKSALLPGDGRYMMTTLATGDEPSLTIVKSVMVSPRNPARGLDGIEGSIIVQDSETGLLLAVMGAKWVTGTRTAGLSAVAARRLADPGSAVLACIGSGAQARGHMIAFADLFPLAQVRIFGRGRPNIDRLRAAARKRGLEPVVCDTPRDAVETADLVVSSVTLSFDIEPFVDARWLKPGAFAAITDVAAPWVPGGMAAFGNVIIDDLEQEAAIGKPMVDPGLVKGDLKGLLGGAAPGVFDPAVRSAFVFRGLAIGDFAVAGLAYNRAVERGIGQAVRF